LTRRIELDEEDRSRFLAVLGKVRRRFHLLIYAYCLMDNHCHLLVETPKANRSSSVFGGAWGSCIASRQFAA
jgi:REP element-mobilizing transposase RayT